MIVIGYKVLHFINNEDHEVLDYKTLMCINTVASNRIYGQICNKEIS